MFCQTHSTVKIIKKELKVNSIQLFTVDEEVENLLELGLVLLVYSKSIFFDVLKNQPREEKNENVILVRIEDVKSFFEAGHRILWRF